MWDQTALSTGALLAVLSASLAFLASTISGWRARTVDRANEERRRQRDERMVAVALLGEVASIRDSVWMAADRIQFSLSLVSNLPEFIDISVSDEVYASHASRLGIFGDATTVLALVKAYAGARFLRANTRLLLAASEPSPLDCWKHMQQIAPCLESLVKLERRLRGQVEGMSIVFDETHLGVSEEEALQTVALVKKAASIYMRNVVGPQHGF